MARVVWVALLAIALAGCASEEKADSDALPQVAKESGNAKAGTNSQLSLNPDFKSK